MLFALNSPDVKLQQVYRAEVSGDMQTGDERLIS